MSIAIVGACLVSCFVSAANPWFYTCKCGQNGCPIFSKAVNRNRAKAEARAGDIRQAGRKKRFWKCGEEWTEDELQNSPTTERSTYQGTEPMQLPRDKERGQGQGMEDPAHIEWPAVVEVPGGVPKAPPSVLSSGTINSIYPSRPTLDEAVSWERLARAGKERDKRKWWYMP